MRYSLAILLYAASLAAADTVEVFGQKWTVPIAADWSVETIDSVPALKMLVARPQTQPRRPSQFALAETKDWTKVTLEAEVKRLGTSMIIVYAYKDPSHFNYAHLSVDTAAKQPVHNGIFHVYGGDRVRISSTNGPASLPSPDPWYKVKLHYDSATGEVVVTVDGQKNPSLRAIDLSLGAGRVGLGSFFETAIFRNVRIKGTPAN